MKIWEPIPKMKPPTRAPAKRRICFCRDEPIVESAVSRQVVTAVLMPGHGRVVAFTGRVAVVERTASSC